MSAISAPQAKVIPAAPAVAEKRYPHIWLNAIHIYSSGPGQGHASLSATHYNGDTGEVAPTSRDPSENVADQLSIADLPDVLANVPEAAKAMRAIIKAYPKIKAYLEVQANEPAVQDPPNSEDGAPVYSGRARTP